MYQPAKVTGFLDLAGAWDPSLAFVMGGAIVVALPAFLLARRRSAAWIGGAIELPTAQAIDAPLVVGSAIFGVGWGLGGVCPAPGVVDLGFFSPGAAIFVVCDGGGHADLPRRRRSALARSQASGAGCVSLLKRARA